VPSRLAGASAAKLWTEQLTERSFPAWMLRVKNFAAEQGMCRPAGRRIRELQAFAVFLSIFNGRWPHLTIAGRRSSARLDMLSVRCLSSYLFFSPYSGDKYASRLAGVSRALPVCRFSSSP
jgi:hypothetical protein